MDDDFIKKRLARDMAELKKLCEEHFKQRLVPNIFFWKYFFRFFPKDTKNGYLKLSFFFWVMYYVSKIGHNNLFLEQSTKKKSKNLKKELQILKRFYKNFYLIICLFISYF